MKKRWLAAVLAWVSLVLSAVAAQPYRKRFLGCTVMFLVLFSSMASAASGTDTVQQSGSPCPTGSTNCQPTPSPSPDPVECLRSNGILVLIDDRCVSFDTYPVIVNGRIMFPMREIIRKTADQLYTNSVFVDWSNDEKIAWAYSPTTMIGFPIGENYMFWDGDRVPLDQGAVLLNGITRVPLRAVIEKLGGEVFWNNDTRTARIYKRTMFWDGNDHVQTCKLHGYPVLDDCPTDRFFLGRNVYSSWSSKFLLDYTRFGLGDDHRRVAYINRFALVIKQGEPLQLNIDWWKVVSEGIIGTALDMWTGASLANVVDIGSLLGKEPLLGDIPPADFGGAIFKKPAAGVNDVWFTVPVTGWSEDAIGYQAMIGERLPVWNDGVLTLQEFWHNGIKFDGLSVGGDGTRIYLDAKSDGGWWLRIKGRDFYNKILDGFVEEARSQLAAIRGEAASLEWHVQTDEMAGDLINYFTQHAPDVLERMHIVHTPYAPF